VKQEAVFSTCGFKIWNREKGETTAGLVVSKTSAKRRQSASHACVCVCVCTEKSVYLTQLERNGKANKSLTELSAACVCRVHFCKKECGTTQNSSSDGIRRRLLLVVA
jgi:hypothetical protein